MAHSARPVLPVRTHEAYEIAYTCTIATIFALIALGAAARRGLGFAALRTLWHRAGAQLTLTRLRYNLLRVFGM
jgi:hypothetical protein